MKIKFNGHSATEREVELTQADKHRLFEIMKQEFINHITYSRFSNLSYPTHIERQLERFCDNFDVDIEYDKDRVAFFTEVIKNMENIYG
jgi:ribosome maturation protein Sdo1